MHKIRQIVNWSTLISLLAASIALYGPWLNSPLVFDDFNVLQSPVLGDYAIAPFSLTPRQFPYFTLGFEHVVTSGDWRISRVTNLVLHGLNGFLLFFLMRESLARTNQPRQLTSLTCALLAVAFVVHPVATYGVAYLVQRTILMATFFSLLSAVQFSLALKHASLHRAIFAGFCFGLSALSKEHAVTTFIGIALLASLHIRERTGSNPKWIVLAFLSVAIPFAGIVFASKIGLIAAPYEPNIHDIVSTRGFPDQHSTIGNWLLSAALQCRFFFSYWELWWWPRASQMSIDIRPDFAALTTLPGLAIPPLLLCALLITALYVLFRKNNINLGWRLSAWSVIWAIAIFAIEMSTIRFQEPFVLYRSYLWAPALFIAALGPLSLFPPRIRVSMLILICIFSAHQAWNRMRVMSNELTLWEEAAARMPSLDVPGASRVIYNRGVLRQRDGDLSGALADFEWLIRTSPQFMQAYWGRADVKSAKRDYVGAIADLQYAIKLQPELPLSYFKLGLKYKKLGRIDESKAAFQEAEKRGMPHVDFEIKSTNK